MPLLMCPNDNASMQTVNRNGVEFDMCPTCRGVWLDRGELEKLIEGARTAFAAEPPVAPSRPNYPPEQPNYPPQQPMQGYGERGEYGERREYGERGQCHDPRRRKRGFDVFDIFD